MKRVIAKSILALAAGVGAFTFPTTAKADHFDRFRVELRRDENCAPRRVWVEPVYEERNTQVWVEPVYRSEDVPVFVNEYFDTKCERVFVQPVYETREVVRYEHGRRVCVRENVCVRPGGWQNVERKVCVPAHYRHEERQVLVAPGHYETKCDRVCVREGYWQTVETVRPVEHNHVSIGFDLHGHL
jgi:hypothetical protein